MTQMDTPQGDNDSGTAQIFARIAGADGSDGVVRVLEVLEDGAVYKKIDAFGQALSDGLARAAEAAGVAVQLQRIGSMACCYFNDAPVHNMADAMKSDRERFGKYFHGMLEAGVYVAPSQFEAGFISAAHDEAAIERTIEVAARVMKTL